MSSNQTPVVSRILVFAPHFAEYSLQMARAMAVHNKVLLIVDLSNFESEVREPDHLPENLSIAKLSRKTFAQKLGFVWKVIAKALIFRAEVVHLQEHGLTTSHVASRLLCALFPSVLTVHDPKPHSGLDALAHSKNARRLNRIHKAVSAFHVHGSACAMMLRDEVKVNNRAVIETAHGPIYVPHVNEIATPSPTRILLFGRMQKYKGVEAFIDMAEEVAKEIPSLQAVLAGTGPEITRLRDRIKQSPHLVLIEKFMTPAEVISEFQKAALIVAPYIDATQSGVVAAAFANGRPVLATSVGGLVDSVTSGVNGILVPPQNPQALATEATKILGNHNIQRVLARNALATANGPHSWRSVADALVGAYADLLGNREQV
jgi:glycosyltransferase involved in cell wall biosynthesis